MEQVMKHFADMDSAIAQLAAAQKTAQEVVKNTFAAGMKKVFAENPWIREVCWAQYTPYFNDGDECIFRIGEVCVYAKTGPNGETEDPDYGDDVGQEKFYGEAAFRVNSWRDNEYSPEQKAVAGEIESVINAAEEQMRFVFGDHVSVTITEDGIDVENYEHD